MFQFLFITAQPVISIYKLQTQLQPYLSLRKSILLGQNYDSGIMSTNFLRTKVQHPPTTGYNSNSRVSGTFFWSYSDTCDKTCIPQYSHTCNHIIKKITRKPSKKNYFIATFILNICYEIIIINSFYVCYVCVCAYLYIHSLGCMCM